MSIRNDRRWYLKVLNVKPHFGQNSSRFHFTSNFTVRNIFIVRMRDTSFSFTGGSIFNFALYTFSIVVRLFIFFLLLCVGVVRFFNTFSSVWTAFCCGFACLTLHFVKCKSSTLTVSNEFPCFAFFSLSLWIFYSFPTLSAALILCRCRTISANVFFEGALHRACGNSSGAQHCPTNYVCLMGENSNPNYGITSFDSALRSFFVVLRIIQRDFWEEVMQYLTATSGPWNILLFIALIYYGSFQLCVLLWTPIALAYNHLKDEQWENDLLNDLNEVSTIRVSL